MPVTPTYPGVYVQEVPSGVRTIVGVSTSVAAFIGYFSRGPMDKAVQVFSWGDFKREFGGLHKDSEASYAIQQFFLNGGTEAWVVRTASSTTAKKLAKASVKINGSSGLALTVTAVSEGTWGNDLRVSIDYDTTDPTKQFNLVVREVDDTQVVQTETFRNLTMTSSDKDFAETVVNDEQAGSKLIRVTCSGTALPSQNGTVSAEIASPDSLSLTASKPELEVTIGSDTATAKLSEKPSKLTDARSFLESAIQAAKPEKPSFARAQVEVLDGKKLRVLAGPGTPSHTVTFAVTASDGNTATELELDSSSATSNVQEYTLGVTAAVGSTAQAGGTEGLDGIPPDATALIGDRNSKKGIYALEDVDIFNIMGIPRVAVVSGTDKLSSTQASQVITVATSYCKERRAFFVLDTPNDVSKVQGIKDWLKTNDSLRDRNVALYFPRVKIADPLDEYRLRAVGASGTIAGLYARTDSERGVWKAPAGTDASLSNVQALEYTLTDAENGTLNPLGINCLRNFPVHGNVSWGARTLKGADQQADEYKYVPIRRLALFMEESLYRGLKWVVFEPNDEPLWAQIRLNVGAFMHDLFRKGAFQGQKPKDAYFVKCDSETTTQTDRNLGIVNIWVGFAPLKPAEFVILYLQQMAGKIQT